MPAVVSAWQERFRVRIMWVQLALSKAKHIWAHTRNNCIQLVLCRGKSREAVGGSCSDGCRRRRIEICADVRGLVSNAVDVDVMVEQSFTQSE